MSNNPAPTRRPAEIELRYSIEQDPIAYLAMGNGHSLSGKHATATPTDIARASVYTCAYLWMLAHPDFTPTRDFEATALEHARWLLEPGALALLTAGASAEKIDLRSPRLQSFETAFLASLPLGQREPMKLQARLPKGLWMAIKEAYGIGYGATDEGFQRLLMGLLRLAQAQEVPASEGGSE
jgi:hypothetical protein